MNPLCINRNRSLAVDELKLRMTKNILVTGLIDALSLAAPKKTWSPYRDTFTAKPWHREKIIEPLDNRMKERLDRLAADR